MLKDEQGQKRWEKAIVTGYENVRRLTHENLLPALERFCVLLSRLRGLSKFQESNAVLGLSMQELDNIFDTTNCLQLLAHHILIAAGSELRQFLAFSTWLRQEIEIQSTDPSSMHEHNERDVDIDHASVLKYIQGAMMKSRLQVYFKNQVQADNKSQWDLGAQRRSLYELYKRELQENSPNAPLEKELPGLDALIAHLKIQCNVVFARIAETQRRNVRFGPLIALGSGVPNCMDMRMVIEASFQVYVYVAFANHGSIVCERNEHICSICCSRAKKRAERQ